MLIVECKVMERLGKPMPIEEEIPEIDDSTSHQENVKEEVAKFVVSEDTSHLQSNFSLQASLASQVRFLAAQRTRQDEDIIGDSDDEESLTGSTNESSFAEI